MSLAIETDAAAPPLDQPPARRLCFPRDRGTNGIFLLAFSPNGRLLASSGGDAVVRVADIATGKLRHEFRDPPNRPNQVVFSPDGAFLVSFSSHSGGSLRLWAMAKGKPLTLPAFAKRAKWATFLPDGRLVVVSSSEKLLYLFDPLTGKHSKVGSLLDAGGQILDLVPGEGNSVVAARMSWETETVDLSTGKRQRRVLAGGPVKPPVGPGPLGMGIYEGPQPAQGARLTPGGRGGAGQVLHRLMIVGWSPGAAKETGLLGFDDAENASDYGMIWALTLSPSGRLAAMGTQDGKVIVAELATGKRIATFQTTNTAVQALAFSPCGRYLAVGELGKGLATTDKETSEVLLWDLARLQGELPDLSTPASRERRWAELVSNDTPAAYRALEALAGSEQTVALVAAHLAVTPQQRELARKLVLQLDEDSFAIREKAQAELARLGWAAEPALRAALADKPSAELRRRASRLHQRLVGPSVWGTRGRALDLLERMGTPAAARLLEEIAKDEPGGWFAVEAREALGRLTGRGLYKPKKD